MYKELRKRFGVEDESDVIVTENGKILMAYYEDVLLGADELVEEVFEILAENTNITSEEMLVVRDKYETNFQKKTWPFVEISLIDD